MGGYQIGVKCELHTPEADKWNKLENSTNWNGSACTYSVTTPVASWWMNEEEEMT